MRIRNLIATAALGGLVAGATGLAMPAAHATTAPPPALAGTVTTWGSSAAPEDIAVPATLTSPVVDVSAGGQATAVVTADGGFQIWGPGDIDVVSDAPTGVTDAVAVALSPAIPGYGLLLHEDGTVTGWGADVPIYEVPEGLHAKAISVNGGGTAYAVRTDGTLAVWGANTTYTTPEGLTGLVDVAAGTAGALALRADGTVVAWGINAGLPGDPLNHVPDLGGKKVTQIATGALYDGVVLEDGTVRIWSLFGFDNAPENQPDLTGKKVLSLSMNTSVAAIVEDTATGDRSVELWGPAGDAVNAPENATALDAGALAEVSMGLNHAAALTTTLRVAADPVITGTAEVGQTLTAKTSYSVKPATETGQWMANNQPLGGQTGKTLTLDDSMVGSSIRYVSSATRSSVTVEATTGDVTVAKASTTTSLTVAPVSGPVGQSRVATATVTRAGGTATGTVTFHAGSVTRIVDLAQGKATWTLPALNAGNSPVTASYNGSASSAASNATPVTVKVSKAASRVAAKAKVTRKAKKVTFTITVATAKGVTPNGKVTIVLKGKTKKTVHATVNASGKATVTVKKLKGGKYTAKATYAGNGNVTGASGSVKFKI